MKQKLDNVSKDMDKTIIKKSMAASKNTSPSRASVSLANVNKRINQTHLVIDVVSNDFTSYDQSEMVNQSMRDLPPKETQLVQ